MRVRTASLLIAAVIAVAFGAPALGVGTDPDIIGPPASGTELRFSPCIIRLYATGPKIHENNAHACLGVTNVYINANGSLEIRRTVRGVIAYVTATIDETLAARGIIAGCSRGSSITQCRLYDTDTGRVVRPNSSAVASSTSNLWMMWVEYVPAS